MNEEPKSFWKKPVRFPQLVWAWLVVTVIISLINAVVGFGQPGNMRSFAAWFWFILLVPLVGGVLAALALLPYLFIRWLCHWRNLKRALFALACLATLIALFYAEEDWRGWHTWSQFKHEWEAKGEHFDLAGVTPAPVPDAQNFALSPLMASSYETYFDTAGKALQPQNTNVVDRMQFNIECYDYRDGKNVSWPTNSGNWQAATVIDLTDWQLYYRRLAAMTNLYPVASSPQSPAADVLLALSKFDPLVEELRAASQLPYSRFPLTYTAESPASILLPHLAAMKRTTQYLRLRSQAELAADLPEKALQDVKLSLRLVAAIRTEPFLITHLVRIAMLQLMLQPVYEGLLAHRWSDTQLVALEAELARLDFADDYQLSMRGEMGCQGDEMDRLRRHPEQLKNMSGFMGGDDDGTSVGSGLPGAFIARLIPAGWFYQNQYRCARMMLNHYVPLADVGQGTFSPTLARRRDAAMLAETQTPSPYTLFERFLLPAYNGIPNKFAYAQSSVDLARTAIALERYRLAHGEYPEALAALAPQYIAQVPHDVIGGGPLKYRREANGLFTLYSVGWNETDDGGVVVFTKGKSPHVDTRQGDWVWRYPAK